MTKNAIHIVHISPYYPPHVGGMELVVQHIAKRLTSYGYIPHVISSTIGMNHDLSTSRIDDSYISRLPSIEIAHTPISPSLLFRLLFLPRASILHVHIAQAGWPEVALFVAKLRRFPYIAHFHLDVAPSGKLGGIFTLYKKYVLSNVLRSANKIIVFSEEQKSLVIDKYNVKNDRITVVPNGVDEFYFNYGHRSEPKKTIHLLFVGRLAPQKRIDRIIESLTYVKCPVRLTIVGDGENSNKLWKLAKQQAQNKITFVGRKNQGELYKYYNDADAFIIGSDREGMPLVILEAMAAGLPIIASDVIGLHELVHKTGILVKNPSPQSFAKAIDTLWNHPKRFTHFSELSKKKAAMYTWDNCVRKLSVIYANIRT